VADGQRHPVGGVGEEVVAPLIDHHERGEVLDMDLPDHSIPSSRYSSTSMDLMQSCTSWAAEPPIEPR
jgi:hypothetical protein